MATTKQPLTPEEQQFWDDRFGDAEAVTLLKTEGQQLTPEGLAHIASDYASAAVRERRLVQAGGV